MARHYWLEECLKNAIACKNKILWKLLKKSYCKWINQNIQQMFENVLQQITNLIFSPSSSYFLLRLSLEMWRKQLINLKCFWYHNNWNCMNPLLPSVPCMTRLAKILILTLEGINKTISYERRDYKSVDEKSLY